MSSNLAAVRKVDTTDPAATNVASVRAIYEAFGRGDIPAILARLRPDVEWEVGYEHNGDVPWLKSGRGRDHVKSFFATAGSGFTFHRFEVVDVIGGGPWVVGICSLEATWKPTGRTLVEAGELHLWRFDEAGMVASMRHVADTRQHARVAGV
jgi:ketosteroid isomerase-like protein